MTKRTLIATIFVALFFSQNLVFAEYSDIGDLKNKDAINYLTELGVIEGYPDGTFRPDNTITRAEFTKIVLLSENLDNFDPEPSNCFIDIENQEWYARYVCYAKNKKIIEGYPDGTFKPSQDISFVEAIKILQETLSNKDLKRDPEIWYKPYLEYFLKNKFAPSSINSLEQKVTRAEIAEMVFRIKNNKTNLDSTALTLDQPKFCEINPNTIANNIDSEKIFTTWKNWLNQERESLGLAKLEYNPYLNITAKNWSNLAKDRGYIDHKREGQSSYYDYNLIQNWFKNFGIEFQLINRTTYTETIGYGYYKCNASDCTDQLVESIKSTYDFIMSEKTKTYRPHYNSLINPNFKEIGLGITLDEATNRYYLTLHYATKVESSESLESCK